MKSTDYIIVGSGPAGSTLAARLSENISSTVLLLEAGGSDRKLTIIMPAAIPFTYTNPRLSWGEWAGAEPALNGMMIDEKRGRVLGGGSSINAMIFNRGNAKDFNGWAQQGANGWSYDDVLPYFKRMETFSEGPTQYRGGEGPLKIIRCPAKHKFFDTFLRSGEQAGYQIASDHNGEEQEGIHIAQAYIDKGRRCNASHAYLHPNKDRQNLAVKTNSHVHRVLFEQNRAIGIQLVTGEKMFVNKEVIIAASTVGAAKLLMLSGVGPAEHLREHDISVVANLPQVGQNLENHPGVNLQYSTKHEYSIVSELGLFGQAKLGLQWMLTRKGLGAGNFFEAGGFVRANDQVDYPNVQFEFLPLVRYVANGKLKVIPGFQLWIDLSRPESRGAVTLTSSDPMAAPKIVFNHLQAQRDCDDLINSIRMAREIFSQPVWDGIRGKEIQPGAELKTDAEILAWMKTAVGTSYHTSGTCRMSTSAEDGVVDSACRVHGLEGLRVVCAAVMPQIVTANLSATTYMIAEKISDEIRGMSPQKL